MQIGDHRVFLLLLSLAVTFVVTRAFLHRFPNFDLNIGRYNVHHLFVGILLMTVCGIPLAVLHGNHYVLDLATAGFGVGLGLALDQWLYLIVTDGTNASYLLPVSFWGGVIAVGLACAWTVLLWVLAS